MQPTAPPQGNINGTLYASGYGGWSVPQGNAGTFSWSNNTFCTVNYGGTTFPAFTVGTPITILDQITPAHNEVVTVTGVNDATSETCSITTTTPTFQHTQFSLGSASNGLQEAINANLGTTSKLNVFLTADWFRGGGTIAQVLASITGNANVGIMDLTATPNAWYSWNGSNYVLDPLTGTAGELGTLQSDDLTNNSNNTAAVDADEFVAGASTPGTGLYTPQQAVNAAVAHNGSVKLMPGAGRIPFSNTGNVRVRDNRADVPADARYVTEFGAACDVREVYGILSAGSNVLTIANGALTAADAGRDIIAVGVTSGGTVTQFESALLSVTDSLHAVLTSTSPFNQLVYHEINLGHDDSAAIARGMTAVGSGGTLVFPQGTCQSHTQTLAGQSPIGLGFSSFIVQMPGEDLFQAPDPSLTQGISQGASHIHDLTFLFDSRIDSTLPWQKCNDSGCTAQTPMYRPIATMSGISSDPLAPGWMVGGHNGVAQTTASSAAICVPSGGGSLTVGETIIFPYQPTIFTTTVASSAGSCGAGFLPVTLTSGSGMVTSSQAEWFAGSNVQKVGTLIGSGSCPTSITLANSINPAAGWESNVAPFGLIQIDGEQFSYFGKSDAGNLPNTPTLEGIQCAQNGTARAAHSVGATAFPLNQYKPAYPWPVIPSINSNDTTPAGTAGYYPGYNVGNNIFSFPVASGATRITTGGWSANAKIENLSFFAWPNEINGESWQEVNHTGLIYTVTPHYAAGFQSLYGLYSFFGFTNGAPSLENHTYATAQPTGDGSHWEGLTVYAANPWIQSYGNENSFADFNMYSSEGTTAGAGLGADTCFYNTRLTDDQTGGVIDVLSLDHFKNIYCEPEGGPHAEAMPNWEWDTYNSVIEDQHMGGGGEVYIGGGQQHWIGGNFNQTSSAPAVVFGSQNTSEGVTTLGSEPKGNVYGVNTLINLNYGNDFNGTTAQVFSSPTGPYGSTQVGGRRAMPSQTGETFHTGNLTAPYTSTDASLITPEEFNSDFSFESQAMNVGYTFDDSSPVTHSYAGCDVGNNMGSIYCATGRFNFENLPIGPDQRLVPGKYTLYLSLKDQTASTNVEHISIFSNCGGVNFDFPSIPITNAWPTTLAGYWSAPIDLSGATGSGCALGIRFWGASTADLVQIGFMDFAPVDESLNVYTLNVTNINTPGGGTGGTPNGCQQSPVVGIKNGYSCPTKGNQTQLTGNQGSTDTTATVTTTSGFSAAGCFFVDGEYECYTSIADGTHFAGIARGAYITTPASHTSGASLVAVSLVLGSPQQLPSTVIAYGSSEGQIFSVNNGTPYNYGGAAVFEVNGGNNTTWIDTAGGIHQLNTGVYNALQGHLLVGSSYAYNQAIDETGDVLQDNHQSTAYSPIGLGGGHAGSLNVIAPSTLPAPSLQGFPGGGSSTASWECTGTDFDGNTVPGTTATLTSVAATWSFPSGLTVACPPTAGINTYQIWRTAGGGSQGLIATVSGPNAAVSDFGGATSGGTPPVTNSSNPHISVAGTGNPIITLGSITITSTTGAPTTTCGTAPNGSGSLWLRTDGSTSTSVYSCAGTTWTAVTIP